MPYLKIRTNRRIARAAETAFVAEATALLTREMHRPGESVAIALEGGARLFLAGKGDAAAFAELTSTHLPPPGRVLGEAIAGLIHRHLGVPAVRVYVKFVRSGAPRAA